MWVIIRVKCQRGGKTWWLTGKKISILALVQTEVTRILTSDGKPERISISRIGKRIEYFLESVGESVEDFQIRRIKWAIQEIEREGLDLQWWRIVRKAGIRKEAD